MLQSHIMPENKVIIYTANDGKTKIDVAAQSADILSVVGALPHLFVFFIPYMYLNK